MGVRGRFELLVLDLCVAFLRAATWPVTVGRPAAPLSRRQRLWRVPLVRLFLWLAERCLDLSGAPKVEA
jgi:hypothetical protein